MHVRLKNNVLVNLDTQPSTCQGCGATIYWAITEKGKRMPVVNALPLC